MAEETKVFRKDCELYDGEIIAYFSKRVQVSDEEDEYRSYESDNVRLSVGKDGHLSVSDWNRDGSVYFYPDQLEHLQRALEVALKQRHLTTLALDGAAAPIASGDLPADVLDGDASIVEIMKEI